MLLVSCAAALAAARIGVVKSDLFKDAAHLFVGGLMGAQAGILGMRHKMYPNDLNARQDAKEWVFFLLALTIILSLLVELPVFLFSRSN